VIRGTGSSLPEKVVTNFDLEKLVETSDEWIATRTGIRERRVAREGETMSQFRLQASSGRSRWRTLRPRRFDLIICATVTPDMPIPSTRAYPAPPGRRGRRLRPVGGLLGVHLRLSIADQFIRSGTYRNVLVIGAELSPSTSTGATHHVILFADGAGAVVLTARRPTGGGSSPRDPRDGSMADYITLPGGGTLHRRRPRASGPACTSSG